MAFSNSKPSPVASLVDPRAGEAVSPVGRNGGSDAFLGSGAKVVGSLHFKGPAEVDGYIEGEIISESRLVIGETAIVKAKIRGVEVIVKGQVQGDIIASKQLSLRRPSKVVGNIQAGSLSIEDGAIFEGSCAMKKEAIS
jgi:cytoskeletal protein CcmA (bactofilin family)